MIRKSRFAWIGCLSFLSLALSNSGSKADPVAMCRPITHGDPCVCSMSSIETPLSFGDAASLIVTFDRIDPGDHNEQLLVSLFRQCSHNLPKTAAAPAVAERMPAR